MVLLTKQALALCYMIYIQGEQGVQGLQALQGLLHEAFINASGEAGGGGGGGRGGGGAEMMMMVVVKGEKMKIQVKVSHHLRTRKGRRTGRVMRWKKTEQD